MVRSTKNERETTSKGEWQPTNNGSEQWNHLLLLMHFCPLRARAAAMPMLNGNERKKEETTVSGFASCSISSLLVGEFDHKCVS